MQHTLHPIQSSLLKAGIDKIEERMRMDEALHRALVIQKEALKPSPKRSPDSGRPERLIVHRSLDGLAAALIAIGCDFDGDIYSVTSTDALNELMSDGVNVVVGIRIQPRRHIRTYSSSSDYYDGEWKSHTAYDDFIRLVRLITCWDESNERFSDAMELLQPYLKHRSDGKLECIYSHYTICASSFERFLTEWNAKLRASIEKRRAERIEQYKEHETC